MKNTLVLTFNLALLCAPSTSLSANDGWFEYFASFIWETKQTNPTAQPQQSSPQPSYTYQPTSFITNAQREQVRRDVVSIIDGLFATHEQNRTTQMEIDAVKDKTLSCLAQRTRSATNVQELRSISSAHLSECLAQTIATNARLLYEQKAARAKGSPAYNPQYMATQIEADVKAQALVAINQNIRGILVLFVGKELEDHVASKVQRDFPAPKQAAPTRPSAPVRPSAPAHAPITQEDNIYEIYVHPKAQRFEEIICKIQQGTTHRASDCCVCMDDFGGAKKRVTLACSHSICPECLYNWLYQSKKNSCPICRDKIRTDEFPAQYLMNYL